MGALVQNARGYEATSDTTFAVAFASNVVLNNLLCVVVGYYHNTVTVSSITDTIGTSYTQAGTLLRNTTDSPATCLAIYYGIAPSSGANTVTLTLSGAAGDKELKIFEISGVDTTTPLPAGHTAGATGSSTAPLSGSITTTVAGFAIKAVQEYAWTTHAENAGTPTTGWTEFGDTGTGADSAYQNFATTQTLNGGFTLAPTSRWCCRIVSFADATAGSTASASGTGTATGTGASEARSTSAATGTGTATGVGASEARSEAAASGTGTATGIGESGVSATGSATGLGQASATGSSQASGVAAAAGTGTATATGAAEWRADFSATGLGTATGISGGDLAVGSASGICEVLGIGSAEWRAIASASGIGAASGIGLPGGLVVTRRGKKSLGFSGRDGWR